MDPVLGPYGPETVRYTVPYSLQHTETYNRTLSVEPFRLYVGESAENELNLNFSINEFPEECTITDNYINISNTRFNMSSSENGGEYYTLDSKIWKLAETKPKTDDKGRVYLSRNLIGQEARVFVSDFENDLTTCKNFMMLTKKHWTELRGIRGENAGKPLEIKSNGDIWTSQRDKFVKVFLKVKP